jgi:hypothetical protein
MRRTCSGIAGVVLACTLAGCGESQPESGTKPFQGTSNPAIEQQLENMSKNMQNKAFQKGAAETAKPSEKDKSAADKAADKK